jgi:pSer/pThr/pTyr-binding forkhead associated (FHA) protein
MPVIQLNDKQHALKPGQTRVGAGPGVDISVSDDASLGVQAVLELGGDNAVVIRRAHEGVTVLVNGVTLAAEPTPLIHGDKVEIGGVELQYVDDKKVGATQFVTSSDVSALAAKRAGPARATAGTGGRIVSLVDGKEYQIPAEGVTFGREAGSDVVVSQPEVSRRHASIAPSPSGYVLKDHSTNGVWVNGTRVQGSQILTRADVVRVGGEEFRFYADIVPVAVPPRPTAPPPAPAPAPVSRPSPPPAAAPPASGRRESTPPSPRAAAQAPARPLREPITPQPFSQQRPKKEAMGATRQQEKGGFPAWLWVIIVAIVGVIAYFVGQGRG